MSTVEEAYAVCDISYPYVPGLLTFREGPAVLETFRLLKASPDVAMFDGQGRAHPRGIGLAAHLGLWLNLPTIGCAKSRLIGEAREPGEEQGNRTPLRFQGHIIGSVLRTRRGVKPVYVSAGHKSNLADAVRLALNCCDGFRVPEPTRRAHAFVNRVRAELESSVLKTSRPSNERGRNYPSPLYEDNLHSRRHQ